MLIYFAESMQSNGAPTAYGYEAPGAPSLPAELLKLREENATLQRKLKGAMTITLFSSLSVP